MVRGALARGKARRPGACTADLPLRVPAHGAANTCARHEVGGLYQRAGVGPVRRTLARAEGSPEKGRKIATTHCARCHVVGDFNPSGGIGSTPSFQLLVRRDDYLERFQTFFERRPHPVFVRVPGVPKWTNLPSYVAEFEVRLESIEDIIAFVRTLRPSE